MPSVLLIIFLLQLIIHILNTIGANTINDLVWLLYTKFPTNTARSANKLRILRKDLLQLKRSLATTSSQDEFAKWAKLRRQHDKVQVDHDALVTSVQSTQTQFNSKLTVVRWTLTTGFLMIYQWYNNKEAAFWIPEEWGLPWAVENMLSFPRAPLGSVSVLIWSWSCANVIKLAIDAISGVLGLALSPKQNRGKNKEPVKVGPQTAGAEEKNHE
ncbi:MAG: GET complex subunit get1 [Cirrosporium novae-zelandiae]|nr:MAG: GET complex subunit get1 [Cirrosporium novae-zelandiae]